MDNQKKPLKENILDSAVDMLFRDLIKSARLGFMPSNLFLGGLDNSLLDYFSTRLNDKMNKHGVIISTKDVSGLEAVDLKTYLGRALAREWYKQNGFLERDGVYIIANGFDEVVKRSFADEIYSLSKIRTYLERVFPNSIGKREVDLEKLASYQSTT